MKEEDHVERLLASVRRAGPDTPPSLPVGFAENVLRLHRNRVQENKAFLRTSLLSVATALIILGTVLGMNVEATGSSGSDDQESTVEMAYSLWDPAGN
jgi:hypothetical protein